MEVNKSNCEGCLKSKSSIPTTEITPIDWSFIEKYWWVIGLGGVSAVSLIGLLFWNSDSNLNKRLNK